MNDPIVKLPEGICLSLYVQPGAKQAGFQGYYKDRLKLRISAPAVEGAANKVLLAYLSHFFAVSKSCVTLQKGEKSREKTVLIKGDAELLLLKIDDIFNADRGI